MLKINKNLFLAALALIWTVLPAAQAAESQVRAVTEETSLVAFSTTAHPTADGWSATVRHTDGRAWHVHLTREEGEPRPESCGKAAVPTYTWRADVRDA